MLPPPPAASYSRLLKAAAEERATPRAPTAQKVPWGIALLSKENFKLEFVFPVSKIGIRGCPESM
jgi:hypothetical protein